MERYSFREEVGITLRMVVLITFVGISRSSTRMFSQTGSSQIIKPLRRLPDSLTGTKSMKCVNTGYCRWRKTESLVHLIWRAYPTLRCLGVPGIKRRQLAVAFPVGHVNIWRVIHYQRLCFYDFQTCALSNACWLSTKGKFLWMGCSANRSSAICLISVLRRWGNFGRRDVTNIYI
jgi:hypothetical protein